MSSGNLVVQCTPTSSIALEYRLSPADRPGGVEWGGRQRRAGEGSALSLGSISRSRSRDASRCAKRAQRALSAKSRADDRQREIFVSARLRLPEESSYYGVSRRSELLASEVDLSVETSFTLRLPNSLASVTAAHKRLIYVHPARGSARYWHRALLEATSPRGDAQGSVTYDQT